MSLWHVSNNSVISDVLTAVTKKNTIVCTILCVHCDDVGVRGSVVVKALCYKPKGRGFDSR
jgi:hypothetical protein